MDTADADNLNESEASAGVTFFLRAVLLREPQPSSLCGYREYLGLDHLA